MYRIELSVGWKTPIIPKKDDIDFTHREFRRWLISANMDPSDHARLFSVGLLGFYVLLYVTKPCKQTGPTFQDLR